ncbi:MAG: vitamin K epoxide reductase family protein [Lysobacteraceae bacterium]|jgi:uncharacterized membrane protein
MAKKRSSPSPGKSQPRAPRARLAADRFTLVLAGIGIALTAYLTFSALGESTPAFCADDSGCGVIQNSHWSHLFGLPLALWGLATYALIALVAMLSESRMLRWQRLWTLSALGLGISIYLTVIGLVALESVCAWCLLSLLLFVALFVWHSIKRPAGAPGMPVSSWALSRIAMLACVIIAMQLYYSGLFSPRPDPRMQALAEHLDRSGAKFYGAFWCPSCGEQKKLFGGAADALPYVECHPEGRQGAVALACVTADIRSFPTWVVRGRSYTEIMQPEELAQRSGFDWNGFTPAKE